MYVTLQYYVFSIRPRLIENEPQVKKWLGNRVCKDLRAFICLKITALLVARELPYSYQ